MTQYSSSILSTVHALMAQFPSEIRLAAPLGIGKPNPFINALYQQVAADTSRQLHIYTALSLNTPQAKAGLEARFLNPFAERVFAGYVDLDYVRDMGKNQLPPNIQVSEFFLKSPDWLNKPYPQQHYISSNYTHIARDMAAKLPQIICQAIAVRELPDGTRRYSLASNTDLSLTLLDLLQKRRAEGQSVVVGVINRDMPFMPHYAEVDAALFDWIIDDPAGTHALFAPPNMPITSSDYAIGLYASSLVQDGGTLQIGIGSLGDAIAQALIVRQQHNSRYQQSLKQMRPQPSTRLALALEPFDAGLYGCSEMFVNGFWQLIQAGIVRREVYADTCLQQAVNATGAAKPSHALLRALVQMKAIQTVLTFEDVACLKHWGILDAACEWQNGQLSLQGQSYPTDFAQLDDAALEVLLGKQLLGGAILHGGFFLGPRDFYQGLRDMPESLRDKIHMSSIAFINHLFADPTADEALKRAQRQKACFINTAMMVTLSGAIVSDGLQGGQVLSGVGGQYNFVAQAHELPDAYSILLLRSHRMQNGRVVSNIVTEYPHCTVPRHLRDVVISEYGIADLRGKTDAEVIQALLNISDSRCQAELMAWAKQHGKLPQSYEIPEAYHNNTPEHLAQQLAALTDLLPAFPFGHDFTPTERILVDALQQLRSQQHDKKAMLRLAWQGLKVDASTAPYAACIDRMALQQPKTWSERLECWALLGAIKCLDQSNSAQTD